MKLKLLEETFAILKLPDITKINLQNKNLFIGKTEEEISLVCTIEQIPDNYIAIDKNWKCIKIIGTLDFSLIGILSKISTILANEKISVFVVSTYNTDYILIKEENTKRAIKSLQENGYTFE